MPTERIGLADLVSRHGFAIQPRAVTPEVIAELIETIERVDPGAGDGRLIGRGGRAYAMRDLFGLVPAARELAGSAGLRGLVEPILGPNAFPVRGLLFDKTPEANWPVPWHQDTTIAVRRRVEAEGFGPWSVKAGVPHVRPPDSILEAMLTLRVHLDDCGPSNGPLRVVPGSHAGGLLGAEEIRDWLGRVPAVACPIERGGVLAMRPLILHASSPATAPAHRRVVHIEYAANPLPDGLEWSETPGRPRNACRTA